MKRNILLTLLTIVGYTSQAQDAKTYNKEIGIFGQQTLSSGSEDNISMMGVQFKTWKNAHFGFRAIAAYGNYFNSNNFYTNRFQVITPDTIVEKYHGTDINMGIVGFGVEAQRTFYKRIVLFAALEVRGGYGTGTQDEHTVTRYNTQDINYEDMKISGSKDANMVYVAIAPTIGAKVQFKRINFGLEMTGINMSYKGLKVDNVAYNRQGTTDFNMGGFSHRLFLNYSF